MIAQTRPTPLGDRNGRGAPASPSKDELKKMLADKDKMLADRDNQIAQSKAQSEKNKRLCTEAYNQHKRAGGEAEGQLPRKKASPPRASPSQPEQAAGPAKGYLLRTSSVSEDESDSEVEFENQ